MNCDMGHGDFSSCQYTWAGLTWDLSPLRKAQAAYDVTDIFSHRGSNYTYVFGVCQDVPADHDLVAPGTKCESTSGSAREVMAAPSAGYQIFTRSDGYSECYRLSGSLADDSVDDAAGDDEATVAGPHGADAVQWGLIDPMNPAEGMYLQYVGGNTCTDSISEKAQCTDHFYGTTYCRRTLRIEFMCNNRVSEIPTRELVGEDRGCEYVLRLNSQYGCPVECPRGSYGEVCHNRGLCAYDGVEDGYTADGAKGTVMCLCKEPYGGSGCTKLLDNYASPETTEHTTLFWVGLFTLFVGLGLFVGARRRQLSVLASGSIDLVRQYAAGSEMVGVAKYATGREGDGVSYQKQEHQRFLEDPLEDDGDTQTFSL